MPVLRLDTPPGGSSGPFWAGRLAVAGQQRDVFVVLAPAQATPSSLRQASTEASQALVLRRSGIVPLLMVLPYEDRTAWVYERMDGVALSWLCTQRAEHIPAPVAAALVGTLAHTLLALGPLGWSHPGPTAQEVRIDRTGQPLIFGFVGPATGAERPQAPGEQGAAALVFRLGLLLAHLLGGVVAGRVLSEAAHPSFLRRVEVRALERAGDDLDAGLIQTLQNMLAWRERDRPPLEALAEALFAQVGQPPQLVLKSWAERRVYSPLHGVAGQQFVEEDPDFVVVRDFADGVDEVTQPGLADLTDVQSSASALGSLVEFTETAPPSERRVVRSLPPGGQPIPVSVGPPPGALPRSVKLPAGFGRFESSLPAREFDSGRNGSRQLPLEWSWWVWLGWGMVTAGLLAAVAGLAVFLLLW